MFDNDIFNETEQQGEPSAAGMAVGKLGIWLLHLTKFAFLIYSGAHGISAALQYAGSSDWQKLAQIVGIVVIEATLAGIYLAAMNSKIQGGGQAVAAAVTYGLGFILAALGIAADSQLNAGLLMSGWLETYLRWGLPLAPGLMALGSLAIHIMEPAKMRERSQANARMELEEEQFRAKLANERASLEEARTIRKMQLASRKAVLQQLYHVYSGEDVQKAIAATAIHNAPGLLRAAGIDVEALGIRPQETAVSGEPAGGREESDGAGFLSFLEQAGRSREAAPSPNGHEEAESSPLAGSR